MLAFQKRRWLMGARSFFTLNVQHLQALRSQRIGDQRAMTAPGYSFGAHDSYALLLSNRFEFIQPLLEFRRSHVVRETAKRRILPAEINRIFAALPQSTQLSELHVSATSLL